jgi:uncharacterized secreted protein with C-terminal beta-propeller domain
VAASVRERRLGLVRGASHSEWRGPADSLATTSGFNDRASSGVYTLAAAAGNLQTVGSVTGLAPGKRIYSVRFIGDRGYVSTFREVDPWIEFIW